MSTSSGVRCPARGRQRSRHVARGLKENLSAIPEYAHVKKVALFNEREEIFHTIEAKPGKLASVRIYAEMSRKFGGAVDVEAAMWGLEVYDEFVAEAREVPSSHPNIDILLGVLEGEGPYKITVS
ncbi:DUF2322 domain-containing protein [Chloropicon primus]|uniref:Uncharacterized protein n=1 Tax=Chloropicon primus TaxID=1764295 RepID=A0A5B8MNL2_9CHLO|nr:hypothetical protein A3770_06p45870 [Chloropicon primus]UPR01289.1 DUF2322 domain-containing protein [Chloropicon primus]|eukprot:QDZ22069.1 hypothetical protein A3770_06p45870 [Chloropicon primus]